MVSFSPRSIVQICSIPACERCMACFVEDLTYGMCLSGFFLPLCGWKMIQCSYKLNNVTDHVPCNWSCYFYLCRSVELVEKYVFLYLFFAVMFISSLHKRENRSSRLMGSNLVLIVV